jgi:heme exporter protein C
VIREAVAPSGGGAHGRAKAARRAPARRSFPSAGGGTTAAAAAVALLVGAFALAFFWLPNDADQGFSQRIFYLHVPVALTAYACFGWGGWKGFRLLATGRERHDLESYVGVHLGTIFASLTLLTGSLWARISWGVWWSWNEDQLVLFLVLFLYYSAYFMLRSSVPDGPRRVRLSAVHALFGLVLIPVGFLAIRLKANYIHPVVFASHGPQMSPSMFVVFCLSLAGMLALASALCAQELAGKRLDRRLRHLKGARS